MLVTSIFSFSHNICILPKTYFKFLAGFILFSAISIWTSVTFSCMVKSKPVSKQALVFSSTGCRPASLCHGPLCVHVSIRPSVRSLTFSLSIFFSETTYPILMKFHRNVPAMVFLEKNLIPSKTVVAIATKLKKN